MEPREIDTSSRRIRAFTTFLIYCFVSAVRCFFTPGFQSCSKITVFLPTIKSTECMRLDIPAHFRVTANTKDSNAILRISLRDGERTIKCQ